MKNNYRIETSGMLAVITPLADFTVFFTREIAEDLDRLESEGIRYVLFHLAHVNWMDSLGTGCLLKAAAIAEKHGKKATLVLAGEKVRFSLRQLGLEDRFLYATSVERGRDHYL
ncbi:MAG: STAS domain-containing protein [Spirochaetes bacterium]|nr:STAS domain-containing protein [Spirochaetota bacterium]